MRLKPSPEVLIMGHPMLFQQHSQIAVTDIHSDDFQYNLSVLEASQLASQGIGLAAPQIGWSVRVLSIGITAENRFRYPQAPEIPFCIWINPQITDFSEDTCWTWEGCLSIPGMRGWVERPKSITVTGYNKEGERQEAMMDGFTARVMQHEIDHLNGILFPMRVKDTSLLIPNQAIEHQGEWTEGWPTENAHKTLRGQISEDR